MEFRVLVSQHHTSRKTILALVGFGFLDKRNHIIKLNSLLISVSRSSCEIHHELRVSASGGCLDWKVRFYKMAWIFLSQPQDKLPNVQRNFMLRTEAKVQVKSRKNSVTKRFAEEINTIPPNQVNLPVNDILFTKLLLSVSALTLFVSFPKEFAIDYYFTPYTGFSSPAEIVQRIQLLSSSHHFKESAPVV